MNCILDSNAFYHDYFDFSSHHEHAVEMDLS